jgi:hypothetical protein
MMVRFWGVVELESGDHGQARTRSAFVDNTTGPCTRFSNQDGALTGPEIHPLHALITAPERASERRARLFK